MKRFVLLALLATAMPAFSVISVRFSNTTNALTGLADFGAVTATNDLAWGIVVDADGDGFTQFIADVGLNLTDGQDLGTNDFFFYGGQTTTVLGGGGGAGGAVIINEADVYSIAGISANDPFAVIWFESGITSGGPISGGDHYGILENAGLLVPPEGESTTDYTGLFAGADPVRPANLTFVAVPEPSTIGLAAFGLLGLLRRKRKA